MYLIDTSVWIDHLRRPEDRLIKMLETGQVLTHPHVIGELALGSLKNRTRFLSLISGLPDIGIARESDVLTMIEKRELYSLGIGYTDCHLLAATLMRGTARLLTHDRRLNTVAINLGVAA